jgi:hypothetical protein
MWGGSGQGQILTEIEDALSAPAHHDMMNQAADITHYVRDVMKPVLDNHYKAFIRDVPNFPGATPATSLLAGGFNVNGEPFVIGDEAAEDAQQRGLTAAGPPLRTMLARPTDGGAQEPQHARSQRPPTQQIVGLMGTGENLRMVSAGPRSERGGTIAWTGTIASTRSMTCSATIGPRVHRRAAGCSPRPGAEARGRG